MMQHPPPFSTSISTKCVLKSRLDLLGNNKTLSPGSLNGCRTAARLLEDDAGGGAVCDVFVASGAKVYNAKIPLQLGEVARGKGDLLLPQLVQGCITKPLEHTPHRSEIQSLAIGSSANGGGAELSSPSSSSAHLLLGSVDAYGHIVVSRLLLPGQGSCTTTTSSSRRGMRSSGGGQDRLTLSGPTQQRDYECHVDESASSVAEPRHGQVQEEPDEEGEREDGLVTMAPTAFSVGPSDVGAGEGSWAGLAFSPSNPCLLASARAFAQSLDVYDCAVGAHLRRMRTLHPPSALVFIPSTGGGVGGTMAALAVTEGSQLSVWDIRAGERGGCVQRVMGATAGQPLYAATATAAAVAVGGAERATVVVDTRKWRARARWSNCLKYEITGLAFSSLDPRLMYVSGLDHQVVCGHWEEEGMRGDAPNKQFYFKGDSRWYGVHKVPHPVDILGGLCESGNYYISCMQSEIGSCKKQID